ncbi:1,6-anhydro-N-acetylmuramyl-L-alanine amidase AmpD [Cellvibrio sp. pealriver]|uniref:1,6-anhydro-N-acetylmuramyl-L-alanine amidase AmpD n=1 Tax=Cellvibrio sp. pealriver TaxID=1622269 RepID=UPI00066FD6F4|nr:1,6-anhydro-N-acetylmuramyl-L-alanine amidase AmpD [Cellvibrio sp. pealriver]
MSITNGWLDWATKCPSPNYNQRPESAAVSLLVIHNISLPPGEFGGGYVQQFFQNQLDVNVHPYFETIANLQVSAHVFIERGGEVIQFVSFNDRAWHAGNSSFEGVANCNDYSIGIELEGADDIPYTDAQYRSLDKVTRQLLQTYPKLTHERITGHEHIAPGRKTDPGPAFDWQRYRDSLNYPPG